MKILLIRHAPTRHNKTRYIKDDNKDLSISSDGLKALEGLRRKMKRRKITIEAVFCSRSKRAITTAKLLFPEFPLRILENFPEIDKGFPSFLAENKRFGKMTLEDWEKRYNQGSDYEREKFNYPSGMSVRAYKRDILKAFKKLITANRDKQNIAIVSHNGPIKSILSQTIKGRGYSYYQLKIRPGSYSEIELAGNRYHLNCLNC